MENSMNDERIPIIYASSTREYYIPCILKSGKRDLSTGIQLIYCPYCRKKQAQSLWNKLLRVLKKEYGLEISRAEFWKNNKRIPQEFFTDEWWKKRGL